MITKGMKKFLEEKNRHRPNSIFSLVYAWRIQKRIERELDLLLWLCMNYPEVFLGENPNARLKKLLLVAKNLNPNCEVELTKIFANLPEPEPRLEPKFKLLERKEKPKTTEKQRIRERKYRQFLEMKKPKPNELIGVNDYD